MNKEADEASKRSVKYRFAKDGKPDTRVTAYFRALVGRDLPSPALPRPALPALRCPPSCLV